MSMDKDQGGNDGKIIMGECFGMNVNDSEVIIWHEYEYEGKIGPFLKGRPQA